MLLTIAGRLVLITLHWPVANADESIMDLMARHVAYQGDHPLFFWGQNQMGTLQAYLGAFFIRFLGSSAFSVRLGTLLLFALYSICLYLLVWLLYTPKYALFITALLSIGAERMISVPLVANGGYAETMFFSALIFLLASWLTLNRSARTARVQGKRLLAYASLGITTGLALWSDQLVLPAVITAGLLLGIRCWRELRGRAGVVLFLCLLIGTTPLLIYNFSASPGQSSLAVLLGTTFSGLPRTIPVLQEWVQTLLIALPLATSMPFSSGNPTTCTTVEPYTQPVHSLAAFFPGSHPWACVITHGAWSLAILLLWGLAVTGALLGLRKIHQARQITREEQQERRTWQEQSLLYARLMVLTSGALWLLLFSVSAGGQWTPRGSSRYLICLVLVIPAILWPLWQNLSHINKRIMSGQRFVQSRFLCSSLLLAAVVVSYVSGLVGSIAMLPGDQTAYNQVNTVVDTLLAHGITRFYSDYDTCIPLILQSNEQVICSVLDEQLQPGLNRYGPYVAQVAAAAHPAYLFPLNSPPDHLLAQRIGSAQHYRHLIVAGDSIYYYV